MPSTAAERTRASMNGTLERGAPGVVGEVVQCGAESCSGEFSQGLGVPIGSLLRDAAPGTAASLRLTPRPLVTYVYA